MLYLLDANVLITAKNQYYEFGRVDQYWEWLAFQGEQGHVKIPIEIYEEITVGKDDLAAWAKANKEALLLEEEVDVGLVQHVCCDPRCSSSGNQSRRLNLARLR